MRTAKLPVARVAAERVILKPSKGRLSLGLREVWRYRELLYFITWRDIKVRYKQTALGATWAIIQPLLMMLVFTLFVGRFVPKPANGIPYPVFTFAALVPWTFFSQSLSGSSQSLVMSSNLVSKVYFPRIILPIGAAGSFAIDFVISMFVLVGLMFIYGVPPTWHVVFLPLFMVFVAMTALSVGVWLSALNVRYRDIVYAVPFVIQVWLFASPVAYSSTVVHGAARVVYGLNPMAGVIEGFRWALLRSPAPQLGLMLASIAATLAIFLGGLVYFNRTERTFADVI